MRQDTVTHTFQLPEGDVSFSLSSLAVVVVVEGYERGVCPPKHLQSVKQWRVSVCVSQASCCPSLCLIAFPTDIDLWPHFVSCRLTRYLNYLHCLGVLGRCLLPALFSMGLALVVIDS